ncbi:MAG: hypothetical protein PHP43_10930 [Methanoculleus sp.]|nr:hypothetical protein [Methanoculleus sp.]
MARDRYRRRHACLRRVLLCALLLAGIGVLLVAAPVGSTGRPGEEREYNPAIATMLAEINETELRNTTYDLQNFSTRVFGTDGNREAGEYLFARFAGIPGLEV